jgi:hypothetical protein
MDYRICAPIWGLGTLRGRLVAGDDIVRANNKPSPVEHSTNTLVGSQDGNLHSHNLLTTFDLFRNAKENSYLVMQTSALFGLRMSL